MALSGIAQLLETFNHARNILIATKEQFTIDDLASAIAISSFLTKLKKPNRIIVSGFTLEQAPMFLDTKSISPTLDRLRDFLISVDVQDVGLEDLSYDLKDNKLLLRLTPREGTWSKEDIAIGGSEYRYDLIIMLGTPDINSLGAIALKNADFFSSTPIVNIDHDAANEQYGAVNVIDSTATSTSELLFQIISATDRTVLDATIATALLSGIIAKTKSFRSTNVTPRCLDAASELIALGADQERIVRELFKTKNIPTLKLWGRALSRLKSADAHHLVWTSLIQEDFLATGANESTLPAIIEELMVNAPEAEIIGLIWEEKQGEQKKIRGILHAERGIDVRDIVAPWYGNGTRTHAVFILPTQKILEAEKIFVEHVKAMLEKRKH